MGSYTVGGGTYLNHEQSYLTQLHPSVLYTEHFQDLSNNFGVGCDADDCHSLAIVSHT